MLQQKLLKVELAEIQLEWEAAACKAAKEAKAKETAAQEEAAVLGNLLLVVGTGAAVGSQMKQQWKDCSAPHC